MELPYYSHFLNHLQDLLIQDNINVIFLLFSEKLNEEINSRIMISGNEKTNNQKSIKYFENNYTFSLREFLYTDLLQTSPFIAKTRGQNWYIPDSEFLNMDEYCSKLNDIEQIIQQQNPDFVFADQTTDFEFNFIKQVCLKRNIPFIRYIANFMNRGTFIHYLDSVNVKTVDISLEPITHDEIRDFVDRYRDGKNPYIYNMSEANLKQYEFPRERNILRRLTNKSITENVKLITLKSKELYIRTIQNRIKRLFYNRFVPDQHYIYYGLHLTTESHVGLNAFPFLNQINLIETISRALPYNFKLYIKLHPWWGHRIDLNSVRRIKKIPSVVLIPPETSIKEVILHSKGIVTLNATTGIEALLLGKPVLAMTPINAYTEHHPNAYLCTNTYELSRKISKLVNSIIDEKDTLNYLDKRFNNSSELRLEADRMLSVGDAEEKAKKLASYLNKVNGLVPDLTN